MYHKIYKSLYHQIVPDQSLIDKTVKQIIEKETPDTNKAKRSYLKPISIAAVFAIFLFSAIPALASNVPAFYDLLYKVSPATAQFFIPVQKSCENNGIKMEVISTYIHQDTAEVYVTLQDLTGNRVDETTDLFDSYSIHLPLDSGATCEYLDFNPETKTATFLIKMTGYRHQKIEGEKVTFSIDHFLSNKHNYEEIPIEVNWETVTDTQKTKETALTGGNGNVSQYFIPKKKPVATLLVPSDVICSPVKGIDITGIGYVDGMLHIQTAISNHLKNDNHGYLFLTDLNGSKIERDYTVRFMEYKEAGNEDTCVDYYEDVFNIPNSRIQNYHLYGSFYTSEQYTEGNWQVTFPLVNSGSVTNVVG